MLTERIIRDAKPEQKPRIIWDGQVKGLGLRITPKGAKSFLLDYRIDGRKRRRWTFDKTARLSLEEARDKAAAHLLRIREGADPLAERQERQEAPTVADAVARFFGEYVPHRIELGRMSERTEKDYREQWKRLAGKLASLKVANVNRQHIEKALSAAKPAPVMRTRMLALLSRLFNLFEHWEYRPQHTNPCRGIERAREEPRDRVLTPSELAGLAEGLKRQEKQNPAAVAAIRFAALTGCRIGEVLSVQWKNVDFETGRLTLPETKTGRRQHNLPEPALEVLRQLPRFCPWPFSATGRAPCTYKNTRKHFQEACAAAGVADARLHDLRRTVMTQAAASGIGVHVLRDLLGHKTTAMADRYIRNLGDPVKEAREQVGAAMASAMAGPAKLRTTKKGNPNEHAESTP